MLGECPNGYKRDLVPFYLREPFYDGGQRIRQIVVPLGSMFLFDKVDKPYRFLLVIGQVLYDILEVYLFLGIVCLLIRVVVQFFP